MNTTAYSAREVKGSRVAIRPRVLHIVDTLGMGGAETWLMALLRHWDRREGAPQIDFVATSGNPGIFDEEAKALGATILYVRFGRKTIGSFTSAFRRILAQSNYWAIHDHGDFASGWHFLFSMGVLPPVRVAHVHCPSIHISAYYNVSFSRKLSTFAGGKLVNSLATHVCGTSSEVLRMYGFEPGRGANPNVSVLHCGFDVSRFNGPRQEARDSVLREFGWPESARLVLFAGRLDPALEFGHPQNVKNSWFALNVAKAAVEIAPSVRLLMAGAGDRQREQMNCHIQQWGLTDQLRLIGVREDMPRLMRAADVLLFPSQQEGLGMVAVEAQATGLPVLASTAVPRECIVIPELYSALDLNVAVDSWAAELLRTISLTRPSAAAREAAFRVSPFSIGMSAQTLENLYGLGQKRCVF
jgi:glycosyltransferase involved in cell wall biosynthesis